jgi:hypothetical protein
MAFALLSKVLTQGKKVSSFYKKKMISVRSYAASLPLCYMTGDYCRRNCIVTNSLIVLDTLIDVLLNLNTSYYGQSARTCINKARSPSIQSSYP